MTKNGTMDHMRESAPGIAGMIASALAIIASNLDAVEQWMRITSLIIGMAVGLITLLVMWRKWRRGIARDLSGRVIRDPGSD